MNPTNSVSQKPRFKKESIFYDGNDDAHETTDDYRNGVLPGVNSVYSRKIESGGFVDLDDKIPFAAHVSEAMNFSKQSYPKDEDPKLSIDDTTGSSMEKSSVSKNSIFDMDFSITPISSESKSKSIPRLRPEKDKCSLSSPIPDENPSIFAESSLKKALIDKDPMLYSPNLNSEEGIDPNNELDIDLESTVTRQNLLGSGIYSSVYKGKFFDKMSGKNQVCALKVPNANDSIAQSNSIVEYSFLKKIEEWKACTHIIRAFGVKLVDNNSNIPGYPSSVAILMEYCPYGNLFDYIVKNGPRISLVRRINFCLEIAGAVSALQDRNDVAIIHHDIKPHNVLLTENFNCKLADFGNASFILPGEKLEDAIGKGTQSYTAPEILEGTAGGSYDLSSDIYSLGCTFYSVLTGKEPFCNVRNAAHQLWYIRKGFFQSGANPITNDYSVSFAKSPVSPGFSLPFESLPHVRNSTLVAQEATPTTPGVDGCLNIAATEEASLKKSFVNLIQKCTSLNPKDRPSCPYIIETLNDLMKPYHA